MNADIIHVVCGPDWFAEFANRSDALKSLALCRKEGIEDAQYKQSLPAVFHLVVEYYPKQAAYTNGVPAVRRHKWAYGQWQKGAPIGFNSLTNEVEGMAQAKRVYTHKGAHSWYVPAAAPSAAPPPPPTSQRSVGYSYRQAWMPYYA